MAHTPNAPLKMLFEGLWLVALHCSDSSIKSLKGLETEGCPAERTITHTPPNQDGRATPSPERSLMADLEYAHAFGNNSAPAASEAQAQNPAPAGPNNNNNNTNNNHDPTATENDKNQKDMEQADENFNSFHYWRPPLPDISGELEMLAGPTEEEVGAEEEGCEEECPVSKCSPAKATSEQIQKVLDCLQPHMDDPDVQGPDNIFAFLGVFSNI